MYEISPYAPPNPTGPGTTPDNPYRTICIPDAYGLLKRIRYNSDKERKKISYERIGPIHSPQFENPIDHYAIMDAEKRKIMDFYMYSYSDRPHTEDDLPRNLLVLKLDEDMRKMMDNMVESNPKLKELMNEEMLFRVNMARIQRGLSPLDKLPQKGSCLILLFGILTVISSALYVTTNIL
jgi:hypothetical protein